jgi:hypothetical protein
VGDLQAFSSRDVRRDNTESSPGDTDTVPGRPPELVREQRDVLLGDGERLAEASAARRAREEAESLASERENTQ